VREGLVGGIEDVDEVYDCDPDDEDDEAWVGSVCSEDCGWDPDDDDVDDEVDVCGGNTDVLVSLVLVVLLSFVNLRICSLLYVSIACKSPLYLFVAAVIKRLRLASISCRCVADVIKRLRLASISCRCWGVRGFGETGWDVGVDDDVRAGDVGEYDGEGGE
jgi:hypothetical protein